MPGLMWMLVGAAGIFAILAYFAKEFVGGVFGLYRVVPVNEAHIRILMDKKQIFSARTNQSSYWYIPFITKLNRLPLTNLGIPVNDIKLNDKDMAKFICDLVCFVNIENLDLAAERLTLTDSDDELGFDFPKLSEDLKAIMESIGRTVATKQSILDIYKDRQSLDNTITDEVAKVFPQWGLKLVDLELKDIKDAPGSTVIQDIETVRAVEFKREAAVKTALGEQESEVARAKSKEVYMKQQVETERQVNLSKQRMTEEIAEAEAKANKKKIEAFREIEFGKAEVARQVAERNAEAAKVKLRVEAEGMKEKLILEAAGEAQKVLSVGTANANVVKLSKLAEAEGTEKLAEAMAKFNDSAMGVKMMDVQKEVLIEKFRAWGGALSKADIKWILSGANAQSFLGLNLDANGGAQLEQFIQESGLSVAKLSEAIKQLKKQ